MRAIVCREFGEPDVLQVEDRSEPTPGPNEVAIVPRAWGLNFVDVLMVAGGYQLKPALPFVPGLEGAGDIVALGRGVPGAALNNPVIFGMRPGAFAEQVVVPLHSVLPLPQQMAYEQGACFRSAFLTAYHGLVQGGRLATGE